MKLYIFITLIAGPFFSCSSQSSKQNVIKTNAMEQIDLTRFKERQSGGHVQFILKDGSLVKQWELKDEYYLEETTQPNSNYSFYKIFYYDTKKLQISGRKFYKIQIGIWTKYDKNGKVIEETNYEKRFPFTIDDLNAKMRKLNINIMLPNTGVSVLRSEDDSIPNYTVITAAAKDNNMDKRFIIIDGVNGNILSDTIEKWTK